MKSILFVLYLFVAFTAYTQSPRLIIRGDDMGFSHSGNEAMIKCYKSGIETSIEVIVPSPWFPEAVKMLRDNPGVDVGIHIALTSEWDNVKYRPVSWVPSLTDSNGYFFPFIWPNKTYPGQALLQHKWSLSDVEKEMRAQIELGLKHIPRVSHISAHMGCYHMSEEVKKLAKKLTVEYGIDIDPDEHGVIGLDYNGPHATSEEKVKSLIAVLQGLKPGKTYLFVDHPGLDSPELRAISHIGYDQVASDRQGVTDAWTDPRVRVIIRSRGIQLIGYRDLVSK